MILGDLRSASHVGDLERVTQAHPGPITMMQDDELPDHWFEFDEETRVMSLGRTAYYHWQTFKRHRGNDITD